MPGPGFPDERLLDVEFTIDIDAQRRIRLLFDSFRDRLAPRTLDDLKLLVTELLGNSIRHYGTARELTARVVVDTVGDGLRVQVHNHSPAFQPAIHRPEGLGLAMMEGLSRRWGVDEDLPHVWFELPAGPRAPGAPHRAPGTDQSLRGGTS